jgi:predicted nuclease with TOPRIM domain
MPVVTIEQRLDRLERIAKLFVRAGLRARRNMRELDEKINMLVDAQIKAEDRLKKFDERSAKSDERFAKFEERSAKSDERFAKFEEWSAKSDERFAKFEEWSAKSDERFAKFDERFKELGERTDQTLAILMRLIKQGQTGRSEDPGPAKH